MKSNLRARVDAAMGRVPCDLLIKNVAFLDVFSASWRKADVAVADGVIVALDSGLQARREISGRGKWLVPGFIDAHVHVESSMILPIEFSEAVLKQGTTSAICDPHEIANVCGPIGIEAFLKAARKLEESKALDLWVMMSSCVPATHLETNGGGEISADRLIELYRSKEATRALGLAEVMNVPGVLFKDDRVYEKLERFLDEGCPLDGHAPLVKGKELSAYASIGINSCHESSTLLEASEKLFKGISVWIREGSVAKDLETLLPLLTAETSTSVGFCTDDRNPLDIAEEGHIDYLVRVAIRKGIPAPLAYRAASWSVARHYGLDRGWDRAGAIAPGYAADLVLLNDADAVAIDQVFKRGNLVSEISRPQWAAPEAFLRSMKCQTPEESDLIGPQGTVNVIEVLEGKIVTARSVRKNTDEGVAAVSVLERYGHGRKPSNAYVSGFGERFNGAIGSSVGHDSHNLVAVGSNPRDQRVAFAALIEMGGGFVVVRDGVVIEKVALPYGGLMTAEPPAELAKKLKRLRHASRTIGCVLKEPFLQLAFLCLPVIPSLKVTDRGLVDVEKFEIISVAV